MDALIRRCLIRTGRPVALLMSHDAPLIAAIYAVLQSGNIYIPLDPSYPIPLLRNILTNSGAELIITDSTHAPAAQILTENAIPILTAQTNDIPPKSKSGAPPDSPLSPDSTAYIIYTSGSENTPKGVRHSHKNILRVARIHSEGMKLTPGDRVLLIVSCSFSMSVMDIFATLLSGAGLWLLDIKTHGFEAVSQWMQQENISIYHSAAAHFTQFCATLTGDENFSALKTLKLGGETIYNHHFRLFKKHFPPHCRFFIGYGLSEILAVTQRFIFPHETVEPGILAIGKPTEGITLYIADEHGQPAPPGQPGELIIHSDFLFQGYQITPEKNPPQPTPPITLFHTGDLAVIDSQGLVTHLGRKDSQVKINGVRIRPEEVEDALLQHPEVKEALAIKKTHAEGSEYLEAWVILHHHNSTAKNIGQHLRIFLFGKIPSHMIPASIRIIGALPRTPTGKTNRRYFDSTHFCQPRFSEPITPEPPTIAKPDARSILLFARPSPFSSRLERQLQKNGFILHTVFSAAFPGEDRPRSFTINGDQETDFHRLMTELNEKKALPDHIIYLWSHAATPEITAFTGDPENAAPPPALDSGFFSLIYLARALTPYSSSKPAGVTLDVISGPLFAITGQENINPGLAAVLGPCRVFPLEYPFIACRYIDIDPETITDADIDLCSRLPLTPPPYASGSDILALRGGILRRETLQQLDIPLPNPQSHSALLKQHGVYLITGGTGGLGLAFAQFLALRFRGKIALLSRNPNRSLNPLTDMIREMETAGAEVMLAAADVSRPRELRRALADIRQRFGHIDGVIHAAGVADPGSVALKQPHTALDVLNPKWSGLINLLRLLSPHPPDFLLLCSSITVFTGRVGMIDYVSANACLDAWAEALFTRSPFPVVSINWDSWRQTGMMADYLTRGALPGQLLPIMDSALSTIEGVAALEAILTEPGFPIRPRITVSKRPLELWRDDGAKPPGMDPPRMSSPFFPAPLSTLENTLLNIWEKWLRIPAISPTDNFFRLGGDSLKAAGICTETAKLFQRPVSIDSLFRFPTIRLFAKSLGPGSLPQHWNYLVPLRETGAKPPFFCVHNLMGAVWSIALLRDCLPPDQPFYAIQAQGLDGSQPPVNCIETIAKNYLSEILRLQPTGPYYLGGRCLGGVIALEMAQQLLSVGKETARLVLIDSRVPYLKKRLSPVAAPPEPFPEIKAQNDIFKKISAAHAEALENYIGHSYPGRVDLFTASFAGDTHQGISRWRQIATGDFRYYILPCRHEELFNPPYAYTLAEYLGNIFNDDTPANPEEK